VAIHTAPFASRTGRVDVTSLKLAHPVEDVVARYGIELKRRGRGLVGRCPFHADGGRPNLTIFPATRSWFCFRCCLGGDVVKFVMLAEGVGFLEAVEHLGGASGPLLALPAILIASLTLIADDDGLRAAIDDARGAVLGALGLVAFAAIAWRLLGHLPTWQVLVLATLGWALVSLLLYVAQRLVLRRRRGRPQGTHRG
jgi:hypothetical protein